MHMWAHGRCHYHEKILYFMRDKFLTIVCVNVENRAVNMRFKLGIKPGEACVCLKLV